MQLQLTLVLTKLWITCHPQQHSQTHSSSTNALLKHEHDGCKQNFLPKYLLTSKMTMAGPDYFFLFFLFANVFSLHSHELTSHSFSTHIFFSVLPWRPAKHGWLCRCILRKGFGHQQTRRGTGRLEAHDHGQLSSRQVSAHQRWSCLPDPGERKPNQ